MQTGTRILAGVAWLLLCGAAGTAHARPVLFLPMDERAGLVARDMSGGQNDGGLHGPAWGEGKVGGGLLFGGAGTDSYVEVPDAEELQLRSAFTIQFWWKKTSPAVQIFFRKASLAGPDNYYAYLEGGLHFTVAAADGKSYSVEAPAPPDGWHHLAFTFDGRKLGLYVDGRLAGSQEIGAVTLATGESPLLIGTHSPGYRYCLAGVLDEFCVSAGVLPPESFEQELNSARALQAQAPDPQVFRPKRGVLVLAKDGKPGATIVIRKGASPLQRAPAAELRSTLRKLTGVRLPLCEEGEPVSGNLILVGESEATRRLGLDVSRLEGDSFIIKSVPGHLVLLGHDAVLAMAGSESVPGRCKAGTANAVHAFLQDVCGVRWFLPGRLGEVVPRSATLEVPALDIREQPARVYALGSLCTGRSADWARRNLLGSSVFIQYHGGHLWYSLIPAERYAAAHPEWFALRDGGRSAEGNHLCTTNPGLIAEALANLKAIYAQGFEWVEIGQTDGYQRCRCPACEASDDYRDPSGFWVVGKPADRIHVFHAALAEAIRKAYPDRKAMILAYGPSAEVPRRLSQFSDNVVVELTHDPPALLERWNRFHHAFTAYVYWFGLYHPLGYAPKSSPFHVAGEIRRMRAAGARGFYFCGGGECWATEAPSYYVAAQLLRRPNLSEAALLKEFCAGLFGPAASPMEGYFRVLLGAADRYHRLAEIPVRPGLPFQGKPLSAAEACTACFDEATLARCGKLLDQAEALAPDDWVKARLRYFRGGFDYVRATALAFRRARQRAEQDTPDTRAGLADARREREALVRELFARQAAAGADFPPYFPGTPEDVIRTGPAGE